VFVFNPFTEGFIAQGRSFTPVKHQAQLARDLEHLPQFLCRQDDIALVEQRPSVAFLSGLKQAGFALPEFIELKDGRIDAAGDLCRRKLGSLRPWAWGPDSVALLRPLFTNVTGEERTADQRFNAGLAQLYSKGWSAAFLRKLLASDVQGDDEKAQRSRAGEAERLNGTWADESWLCAEADAGVEVETLDAALKIISAIRARGHHRIVVKEALGVAGSNSIRLWEPAVLDAQCRWMANALENGRHLVIEPWLERELDFSAQLEMGPEGLKLCGFTGLLNDRKGQFQANWAESHHHRRIPARVAALLAKPADISNRLQRLYAAVFALLEAELRRAGHVGPIGIDAFVYRTPQGECRLKPIVEINPRYTMGRLTVELMKQTSPGSCGLFRLVSRAKARAEGFDDFISHARSLSERHPIRLAGEPVSRISEGVLCLNDPAQAQACLAIFQVSRTLDALNGK
jgi:hypothetical protein